MRFSRGAERGAPKHEDLKTAGLARSIMAEAEQQLAPAAVWPAVPLLEGQVAEAALVEGLAVAELPVAGNGKSCLSISVP
jgi:hypothetical protein